MSKIEFYAVNRGKWLVVCGKRGVPLLMQGDPMSWESKEEAEEMARWLNSQK